MHLIVCVPCALALLMCGASVAAVLASGATGVRPASLEPPVWVKLSASQQAATASPSSEEAAAAAAAAAQQSGWPTSLPTSGLPACPLLRKRMSHGSSIRERPHPNITEGGYWLQPGRVWRSEAVHAPHPSQYQHSPTESPKLLRRQVHILPMGLGVAERALQARFASPPSPSADGACSCEPGHIGVRWPHGQTQSYTLYTSNPLGLSEQQMLGVTERGRLAWQCGAILEGTPYLAETSAGAPHLDDPPNGKNEVLFTLDYETGSNVWAMVVSWGYFDDPPYIYVEADMFLNSKLLNAGVLPCVVAHEMGHMFGLSDVYGSACWDRTLMFGSIDSSSSNSCPTQPSLEDRASFARLEYRC